MSQNPTETLFTHFAYFISEANFGYNDWQLVASEFGVNDIAEGLNRFYRSWRFGDDDRTSNTVKFLRRVHDQDPDTAFRVMERAYSITDGANEEQIRKYPSLKYFEQDQNAIPSTLPAIPVQSENFIDVDNVPGQFYPSLIENINDTYRYGIYDATFILTRKLLESLLIDILRRKYGTARIDLYYDTNEKRHQNFGSLVENFGQNLEDFEHISGALVGDFIDDLNDFRQTANAEAHVIDLGLTESDVDAYRETAEHITRVLFRIYENV